MDAQSTQTCFKLQRPLRTVSVKRREETAGL